MSKKSTVKKSLSQAQKQEVSRLIQRAEKRNTELKYLQTGVAPSATLTYSINTISDVPAGTGDSARVGDEIEPVSLHLKLQLETPFASTAGQYVRVVIFQWKASSSGEAPTSNALFINDATAGTRNFRSYWSIDRSDSYSVLYDKVFRSGSVFNIENSTTWFETEVSLARAKKQIQFEAAGLDGWGKLYIAFSWNTLTAPTNVVAQTMFRYRDK